MSNIEVSTEAGKSVHAPLPSTQQFLAFLANPNFYRIEALVKEQEFDTWRIGNHHNICPGDLAIIWKSKGNEDKRGIVAFAEVIAGATLRTSPNPSYYTDIAIGTPPAMRVNIRYVQLPNLPLWHDEDPDSLLGSLNCCKATGGSIFKASAEAWHKLIALAGGWSDAPASVSTGEKKAIQDITPLGCEMN